MLIRDQVEECTEDSRAGYIVDDILFQLIELHVESWRPVSREGAGQRNSMVFLLRISAGI